MPDLVAAVGAVASALGIAGLIGQWYAGGKDRRAARANVLEKLAKVERASSYHDGFPADRERLRAAIRDLQSAALIARVPRSAVMPYVQLATACLSQVTIDVEERGTPPEFAGCPIGMLDVLWDAAETVSRAAWSAPATRSIWLPWRLRRNARRVKAITSARAQASIESPQRFVR